MSNDTLRRGDLVEVKSPAEVLATLDERGALEDLPFMPEMAALCGRRFVVDGRAESCLLYTSPSPRDGLLSRMPSSA